MPHKIYVGNYPLSFIEDDVLNLFQDYEGVELVGFFKNKHKCYSFLHCISERQLIEIVANLHDIDVCGRNLVVRAADEILHKQIQKSILQHGGAINVHPRNTCDVNSSISDNGIYAQSETRSSKQSSLPQMVSSYSKNAYPRQYEMGTSAGHSTVPNTYNNSKRIPKQNHGSSDNYESHDYSEYDSSSFQQSSHSAYARNSFGGAREKNTSGYRQNLGEFERKEPDIEINPQETFSRFPKPKTDTAPQYKTINERFESYKTNMMHSRETPSDSAHQINDVREGYLTRNRSASESSAETDHHQLSPQDYESLSFVSVVNFPLHLPTRDLYKLFSDFNPLKVFIVCNKPRMDKTPTEAIVCFENEKDATDAILNLDNTVYRGRILIVTDAVDMSLVSELLSFG